MVHVTSEIGRLRKVLVHQPGGEVDVMVPAMMDDLLFDDILYGDRARQEHAIFRRVLQLAGVEVVEAGDLLREVLAEPGARDWLLAAAVDETSRSGRKRLSALEPDDLATAIVEGARAGDGGGGVEVDELFDLAPLPNWCFQRDPQIVLGDRVLFCAMAAASRHREALLARLLFRFHPSLAATAVGFDPLEVSSDRPLFSAHDLPRIEGGDVLVLSPDVVAVGRSERTNRAAIRSLADALSRTVGGPRWLVIVEVPRRRAYMHLDTVFTPLDHDACLVFPPVIVGSGPERVRVFEIDLHAGDPVVVVRDDLLSTLAARGLDLEPIPCGGSDPVLQQREQWTDGANALAVAPGIVTLYDRNIATADELSRRGFRIVHAEDALLGREKLGFEGGGRICVLLPSHEMSRARGGPHCLTHPLVREDA
jgi:arginine deiminase